MTTILVAEDDANVRLLIEARLKTHFHVVGVRDGQEALEVLTTRPIDLLVADVMMPRLDGFALVQEVRRRGMDLPVLILTAKQALGDKQRGFSSGTDDYMTKPVQYEELLWRIRALLRRAHIHAENQIGIGPVVVDANGLTVRRGGVTIELPKKEFELLFRLLSYPGQIFTKTQLLDAIWGHAGDSGEDTVKTHMSRLRGRLEGISEFRLVTVKGLGYKAEIRESSYGE